MLAVGSLVSFVAPVHAEPATAVFYGYVVPDSAIGAMPKRVRAIADSGAVCGSADVAVTPNARVGFYAIPVVSSEVKPGCPTAGDTVRFALVYGMVGESGVFGMPGVFAVGEPIEHHLYRVASTAASVVSSPTLLP